MRRRPRGNEGYLEVHRCVDYVDHAGWCCSLAMAMDQVSQDELIFVEPVICFTSELACNYLKGVSIPCTRKPSGAPGERGHAAYRPALRAYCAPPGRP